MTQDERLVRYRMRRANEAIAEAELLAGSGHWNTSVNRLYYACFYAASALLTPTRTIRIKALRRFESVQPGVREDEFRRPGGRKDIPVAVR
jgi:hypothetical protein